MSRLNYLVVVFAGMAVFRPHAAAEIDFNRDVRPVLSDNCFQCHGPDEKRRMAGLRLDTREGAFAETPRGALIVPGDPAKSLLFQRITHAEPSRRMPPPSADRTLSARQVEVVKQWIAEGANWQTHWAFVPPERPEPPPVKDKSAVRNPIDQFIQSRLETEGLEPNPEAERRTLLRRLSFDLTGLPPSHDEVETFVRDKSPDAYEKQVDRLLASSHYGERMAMDWLDVARYADTHGYHIDSHREMWPWRDWVIKAFNSNIPFDQFTVMQLAGDLLPDGGDDSKIASGFNRNHMINFEGGAIAEEYLVEYVADRVETTATAWMGLTMGCARCHTHKYDPISHKEYYGFFAFFNNVDEKGLDGRTGNAKPLLKLPTPEQARKIDELACEIESRESFLESEEVSDLLETWRSGLITQPALVSRKGLEAHYDFDGSLIDTSGGYRHGRTLRGDPSFGSGQVNGSVAFDSQTLVTLGQVGNFQREQPFTVAFWQRINASKQTMPVLQKVDASQNRRGWEIRLIDPVLVDIQKRALRISVRLTSAWPDDGLEIQTEERVTQGEWNHIALVWDGSGRAAGLAVYLNGEPVPTTVVEDRLSGPIANSRDLEIGANEQDVKAFSGALDDLRFYTRALAADEVRRAGVDYPIQALLSGVGGKPSESDDKRIREYYLKHVAPGHLRQPFEELKELRKELAQLEKQVLSSMVMSELDEPRKTHVLARGDYRNKTEVVEPATPAILPPLPKEEGRPNRLTLARWLTDPAHPLTARVAVNRYWQMYFGTGLVKTSENFGSQGEPPSHPELLDWLATEFIRSGWDIKAMQRLIVTSAAYRRASTTRPLMLEKDPENRLLARGPRHRLPAEMIRDNALAVSGLLNTKVGGPGVFPYQPDGVWEELAYGDGFSMQEYRQSHGEDLYRRSMYTFWKRTAPPAQLSTFDAPDREKCTARRTTTNTPLQALVLMNDPTYLEASRSLAQRALKEAGRAPQRRAALLFERVTARAASRFELKQLVALAKDQLKHFREAPAEAAALLTNGESPFDEKLPAADLATWTVVASTILNLDETISKE